MTRIMIVSILLVLVPGSAFAASGNASSASGTANAAIVAPIVLTHTSGAALNFGKFTVGSGGTVIIAPGGGGSVTGGVAFVPGSTTAADAFAVTGDPGRNFAITTSGGSVTAGSTSMAFTTTPSASQAALGAQGSGTFTVGSTLTVASTVTPGTYSGTYTATVTYD